MEIITINTEFIKISQLLKLASLVSQGSDAKFYISNGMVKLNGNIVSERGKKVRNNDIVELKDFGSIKVISNF